MMTQTKVKGQGSCCDIVQVIPTLCGFLGVQERGRLASAAEPLAERLSEGGASIVLVISRRITLSHPLTADDAAANRQSFRVHLGHVSDCDAEGNFAGLMGGSCTCPCASCEMAIAKWQDQAGIGKLRARKEQQELARRHLSGDEPFNTSTHRSTQHPPAFFAIEDQFFVPHLQILLGLGNEDIVLPRKLPGSPTATLTSAPLTRVSL